MMKKLKIDPNVLSKCVPKGQEVLVKIWLNDDKTEEAYVCKTCKRYLEKGKMPPECRQNNLQLDPQPDVMKLTELESNLIARNIQFQKIYQLYDLALSEVAGVLDILTRADTRRCYRVTEQSPR